MFSVWCDPDNPAEADLKEWFVGFCYYLRNILFHRTIDPFNSRWSGVMKACYQGLREFLLANIAMLNTPKLAESTVVLKNDVTTEYLQTEKL